MKGWRPDLNPVQQEMFDCPAGNILGYGEKGSGKGIGGLHTAVRHCYENDRALALVISPSVRSGTHGLLYDLKDLVLPSWRDGNRYPLWLPDGKENPKAGELSDHGMGLEYTEPKQDPHTKDWRIYIRNRHGTKSTMLLFSIPYGSIIEQRIKQLSPSFVLVDELTDIGGPEFFTFIGMQLGRRRNIEGPQQYMGLCNPQGPKHWVYKVWFEECIDEHGNRDPAFAVFHIPFSENQQRLPLDYQKRVAQLTRQNSVLRRRLVDGEWVDMPEGDSIFAPYFRHELVVRGDESQGIGELPLAGWPIVVGWDPGPVNFAVTFIQPIPTRERTIWKTIDEVNLVGRRVECEHAVRMVLNRMALWDEFTQAEYDEPARFIHVCDEQTWQPHAGLFSVTEITKHSQGLIRLRKCPKGKDTRPARVQMLISLMVDEALVVSAICVKTVDMLQSLVAEKVKDGVYDPFEGMRPKKSPHAHAFDALTYPMSFFILYPQYFAARTGAGAVKIYACGTTV